MKNIKHLWSLICEKAIIDGETNNVSIINAIERFSINIPLSQKEEAVKNGSKGFSFPIPFEVVTVYRKSTLDKEIMFSHKITLQNTEHEILAESNNVHKIERHITNFRIRNQMRQLLVDKSGLFSIGVWCKENDEKDYILCHEIPFDIILNFTEDPKQEVIKSETKTKKKEINAKRK